MAGVKRSRDGVAVEKTRKSDSQFIPMFEDFRFELDEHHDRRERVIKASRDITAQSKKIIFALQRTRELGKPIEASIAKQNMPMYSTIKDLFKAVEADLQGLNAYRYHRQISPGMQEYMEAVLFQHYLESHKLTAHDEAAKFLPDSIMLTYEDYALGLFDMTGELMRFAITYMATNQTLPGFGVGSSSSCNILADMQDMRSQLEVLDAGGSYGLARDFEQKLKTTRSSVEKVEIGVYSMIVRGKERPKGWRPDTTVAEGPRESDQVESY